MEKGYKTISYSADPLIFVKAYREIGQRKH